MSKIKFAKMVASGNDFAVIEAGPQTKGHALPDLAKEACDRKFGIGADGMLLLERTQGADIRMRIFNADGTEAEMCGNGARCAAFYICAKFKADSAKLNIRTLAGIILAEVHKNNVKIRLTDPKNMMLDVPIKVNGRALKVNFINTGVPHAVIFVQGLEAIGVFELGRMIRHHDEFAPAGTNVDFVEIEGERSISVRTYERGVEDETLACGTGSVASALISAFKMDIAGQAVINVRTKSREVLKVHFERTGNDLGNIWLEGKAAIVYQGEYYV